MARISERPRYWLTLCVQMPGQKVAMTVIEDSTRDLDKWIAEKPIPPKGSLSLVKVRLTVREYRAGELVEGRDLFNARAIERFKANGFSAIPEIPAHELGTDSIAR